MQIFKVQCASDGVSQNYGMYQVKPTVLGPVEGVVLAYEVVDRAFAKMTMWELLESPKRAETINCISSLGTKLDHKD